MRDNPFIYVRDLCFSNEPPPNAVGWSEADIGAPMGAYPFPCVEDKGNRFWVKSKAEDTEKERLWRAMGLPRLAKLLLSRGSSCSRESFLEEEIPDREEEEEVL